MSRNSSVVACVLLLALLSGCASAPISQQSVTSSPGITAPAQTLAPVPTARSSPLPDFTHIYIILMENKESDNVIGSGAAPYINSLARQYDVAANFFGTTHPSLPNYLELLGGSTFGVTSDCLTCYVNATNLVDQLEAAGKTWKAYMEDMPSPCFVGYSGDYAQKHNPFIYFDDIRTNPTRCANIVPLSEWSRDEAQGNVANFVWITPNLCHDTHDCDVSAGDAWLKGFLPTIFAAPDWQSSVLFLLWDEGVSDAGCCQIAHGGHIPMLLLSPLAKPGFTSTVNYDHASVLRTIEEAWGLTPLRDAACSCTAALTDFFADA
jgi:phospholipase C